MKVAVCVSGLLSGDYVIRNNVVQKEKFSNADFYYATWIKEKNKFQKNFPNDNCFFFEEPEMHYHPYFPENFTSEYFKETKDWILKTNKTAWSSHHTKQILIHALLLNNIKNDYDIIVRTRFDAFIWRDPTANFESFLEDSFRNNRVNAFAVTRKPMFKTLYESDYVSNPKMKYWLLDQLIIHPTSMFDIDNVFRLHQSKQLRAAEYGWHQVLSEPYGNNHRNWHGWVNHDKNIEDKFLREL
jgi:hypothetical protein